MAWRPLALMVVLLTVSACAGKQRYEPGWISGDPKAYPSARYMVGHGSSPRLDDAKDRARTDIAKVFQVAISESSADMVRFEQQTLAAGESRAMVTKKVRRLIETRTEQVLRGVEIAEIWKDPSSGDYFVLALLDRSATARSVRADIEQHDRDTEYQVRRAKSDQDALSRVASAGRAVELQRQRGYLLSIYQVLDPNGGQVLAAPSSLDRLWSDYQALVGRITVHGRAMGDHKDKLEPLLQGAIANAGFDPNPGIRADFVLNAELEVNELGIHDGWYWLTGSIEIFLVDDRQRVRGSHRWPLKVSALEPGQARERLLSQVDGLLKSDLRKVIIEFSSPQD